MLKKPKVRKMTFDYDANKPKGLPKLPDNYWKNQEKPEENSDVNTIFDKNLKASLEDVSVFGKRKNESK